VLFSLFHRSGGNSALLEWRIGAFLLAAALGLAGVSLEISWLVTAALIVLMGGLALRALAARGSGSDENDAAIDEQEPKIPE
jgi:hypothetical protein